MTTTSAMKIALKEDIKCCLEVLWDAKKEKRLFKIFTRDCLGAKSIHSMLGFSKPELKKLSCREDYGTILYLQTYELGKLRMIFHCLTYLKENNLLPEELDTFRFNSITRKDYNTFVKDPSSLALTNSTSDMTTTPPANSGLAHNFNVAYSPAESFKILSKEMQVFYYF